MHQDLAHQLQQGIDKLGLEVNEAVTKKLLQYVGLLHKWNRAYNLTAVRKPELMVSRHILDSLVIVPYLEPGPTVDVGTGAGLPGIPLALLCPGERFFLVDSNSKKTRFITQAVAELGLENVTVIHARVEDFQPEQRFDTVISRAYSTLANMIESTRHLLAENGRYLAMKGVYPVAELDELPADVELVNVIQLQVPELDAERHLIIARSK